MNEKPFSIFVVDDDELFRMMLMDQLRDLNYQLEEFDSGEACLARMDQQPNLILLDIGMPGKSGIDICREIRADDNTDVHIIFVTAHDDLNILLQAYEAGGNDFILKNAQKELLLHKIEFAITQEKQKHQLKSQLSSAQRMAFTAMFSLGETGVVLQFLRSSFSCSDQQQFGELMLEVLQQFNLKGLVRLLDAQGDEHDFSTEGYCNSLEQSILSYIAKMERIYQSQDRVVFNYPNVTILILQLNLEDVEAVGRLRDNFALIAEAASVRLQAMNSDQVAARRTQLQLENTKVFNALLDEIEQRQKTNHSQFETVLDQYRMEVEQAFVSLGLTDAQELRLHDAITHLTERMESLFKNDQILSLKLHEVIEQQKRVLGMSSAPEA